MAQPVVRRASTGGETGWRSSLLATTGSSGPSGARAPLGRLYSTGTTQPLSARATVATHPYRDKPLQARLHPERATLGGLDACGGGSSCQQGSKPSPRLGATGHTPAKAQLATHPEPAQVRVLTTSSPNSTTKAEGSPVQARTRSSAEIGGSSGVANPLRTFFEAKRGCSDQLTVTGTGSLKVLAPAGSPAQGSDFQRDVQGCSIEGRAASHDQLFRHRQRSREPGLEAVSTHSTQREGQDLLQTLRREMWTEYLAQSRIFEALQTEVREELRNFKDTIAAEVALRWEIEARVALEASQRLEGEAQLREISAHLRDDIQRMELRLIQHMKSSLEEEAIARKAVDNHLEEQMGRMRSVLQAEFDSCNQSNVDDLRHSNFAKQCEDLWLSQLERHEIQRSVSSQSPRQGAAAGGPAAVPGHLETGSMSRLELEQGLEEAAQRDLLRCGSTVALNCTSKDAFVGEISVEAAVSIAAQVTPGQPTHETPVSVANQEMTRCPSAVLELRAAMQQHNQLSRAVADLETRVKSAHL